MARLTPLTMETASEAARAGLEEEMRLRGRLTNLKLIQARSPDVLRIYGEWFTLKARLAPSIPDRALFLFCLSVARAQRSAIPIGYFRRALTGLGHDPDRIEPNKDEVLLIALGEAVGSRAGHVSGGLWCELASRYDETLLVDLVGFAGQMVATTVLANLFQAEPDEGLDVFMEKVEPWPELQG